MIQNANFRKRLTALALVGFLLPASVASAIFSFNLIFLTTPVFIDGVDIDGNRSFENGSLGTGRIVKDTVSGFIVQVAQGLVTNDSEAPQTYRNVGVEVFDPETNEFEISLVDILRVGPSGRARLFAVAINDVSP
jgi:hypothetical protein